MSKEEKRLGIPPVPVRRKLQPDQKTSGKSIKRKKRWRGRYTADIHAEVKMLRRLEKDANKRAWEYNVNNYINCDEWFSTFIYGNCESALKEGFRAFKECKERERPFPNNERDFCERHDRWKNDRELTDQYWYKGYDIAKNANVAKR